MAKLPGIADVVGQPLPSVTPDSSVASYQAVSGQEGAGAAAEISQGQDISKAGEMVQAGVDKYNEVAAENAINKLTAQRLDLESQVKQQKGEAAVTPNFVPDNMQKFGALTKSIGDTLSGPQQELFNQRAQVSGLQFQASVLNHQSGEMDQFTKTTAQGMIDSGIQAAGMYAPPNTYNNHQVALQLVRAKAGAVNLGAAYGFGPDSDFVKNKQAQIVDEVTSTRILTVANSDPMLAKVMFDGAKDTLTPKTAQTLEAHITPMAQNWIAKTEGQNVVKTALDAYQAEQAKVNLPTNPVSAAQTGGSITDLRTLPGQADTDPTTWDKREDGSQKGQGFLGLLRRKDGGVSSEISIGTEVNGKDMDIPLMVPTLSKQQVQYLLNNPVNDPSKIPDAIVDKAVAFAQTRLASGKSVFAQAGEQGDLQAPAGASVATTGGTVAGQNNPGNMRPGGQFASYASPEQGFAAMVKNLQGPLYMGAGKTSVSAIINTWAPPKTAGGDNSDASTANYIKTVSTAIGVDPSAPLNLQDPATLSKLTYAMSQFEHGKDKANFTPQAAQAGTQLAMNGGFKGAGQVPGGVDKKTDLQGRTDSIRLSAEARADKLFPGNPVMKDQIVQEALGGWAKVIAGQAAMENADTSAVMDAVMGGNQQVQPGQAPAPLPTTWAELRQDPKVASSLDNLPAQTKVHIGTMLAQNAQTIQGRPAKVDGSVYMDTLNKIQSGQITEHYQLTPLLANGLGIQNRKDFEGMIDARKTGADVLNNETTELAGAVKQQWMKTPAILYNPMLQAQVNDSLMAWHQSVQKDISAANQIADPAQRAATIRELFDPNSKTYVGGAYAQRFTPTAVDPSKTPAANAAAAQVLTAQQVAQLPKMTADPTQQQTMFNQLPPGAAFVAPDGSVRRKRGAASPKMPSPTVPLSPTGYNPRGGRE